MILRVGKSRPLSLVRRNICDFLRASLSIPTVTIGRTMNLGALVSARQSSQPRPSWCALFTKAYAIVASRRVELRRACLEFPWTRAYDHPENLASVVVESEWDGEAFVLPVTIANPELCTLHHIGAVLSRAVQRPLEVKTFRRSLLLARLPRSLRRFVWWHGLNVSGYRRARWFGTFGVTSVAGLGADSLRPLSPWSTLLHYGVIDSNGTMTARLTYDHRIFDGAIPSLALRDLEDVMRNEMLTELRNLSGVVAA